MPVSSIASVPAGSVVVKTAYCVECWTEQPRRALRTHYGRELCQGCYRAEEAACFAVQEAEHESMDWGRAATTSDRLESIGNVLSGMGF